MGGHFKGLLFQIGPIAAHALTYPAQNEPRDLPHFIDYFARKTVSQRTVSPAKLSQQLR
jgi:hypothetical protein